jgi:arsenate reductase
MNHFLPDGNMADTQKILFLCTGNSCRSQMAEGFARELKGDQFTAYSAGVDPHGMNPLACRVMEEAGVDISGGRSKHVDDLKDITFDYVVTVCGHADETCPRFPGETKVVHHGFDDPPRLAQGTSTDEEALPHYRRVRDAIKQWIQTLPEGLENG